MNEILLLITSESNKKTAKRIAKLLIQKKLAACISLKDIYKVITDANIQDTRKSFVLLWIIASFTVFIVIWASVSEINQVVRANGEVTPESQVHMIQTNLTGPIEAVNIKLGDKIKEGDIIFTIARSNYHKAYLSAIEEVKTRKEKVAILEDLLSKGAESQMRVIDEKLLLLDAEKRLNTATTAYNYSEVKSSATGTVSIVTVSYTHLTLPTNREV